MEQTNSNKGKEISKISNVLLNLELVLLKKNVKDICENAFHSTVISFSFHLMLSSWRQELWNNLCRLDRILFSICSVPQLLKQPCILIQTTT